MLHGAVRVSLALSRRLKSLHDAESMDVWGDHCRGEVGGRGFYGRQFDLNIFEAPQAGNAALQIRHTKSRAQYSILAIDL